MEVNIFQFALAGLFFEVVGLLVLLGRNDTTSLQKFTQKKFDGLDEWQLQIDKILRQQRKKHWISSFLIVIGICLQVFPAQLISKPDSKPSLEALVLCAQAQNCDMTIEDYERLSKLQNEHMRLQSAGKPKTPLGKFRVQYPQYDDLTDRELGLALHEKYYSDIGWGEFWRSIRTPNEKMTIETR